MNPKFGNIETVLGRNDGSNPGTQEGKQRKYKLTFWDCSSVHYYYFFTNEFINIFKLAPAAKRAEVDSFITISAGLASRLS